MREEEKIGGVEMDIEGRKRAGCREEMKRMRSTRNEVIGLHRTCRIVSILWTVCRNHAVELFILLYYQMS